MEELLDTQRVAVMLGIKAETVRGYKKRGILPEPDDYFGRSPAWRRSTIEEWDTARKTVLRVSLDDSYPPVG
jgi:predicted DNA-binding transcriptional regulator AlpA